MPFSSCLRRNLVVINNGSHWTEWFDHYAATSQLARGKMMRAKCSRQNANAICLRIRESRASGQISRTSNLSCLRGAFASYVELFPCRGIPPHSVMRARACASRVIYDVRALVTRVLSSSLNFRERARHSRIFTRALARVCLSYVCRIALDFAFICSRAREGDF